MNKFILWLALLFGGGQVMLIRELPVKSYSDDWHCGSCGSLLCTGCGWCLYCEGCHCKRK